MGTSAANTPAPAGFGGIPAPSRPVLRRSLTYRHPVRPQSPRVENLEVVARLWSRGSADVGPSRRSPYGLDLFLGLFSFPQSFAVGLS